MADLPTPINRKEEYLNAIATGNASDLPEPITREEAYLYYIAKNGSGSGGTTDYSQLSNKPSINDVELSGDKTASQLGLATEQALSGKQDVLSAGDYIKFNGNEISVNRDIAVNSVRRYVFRGSESTRYIDTYFDDELVSTVSMYFTESARNFNDEISVVYDGTSKWLITNLKASTTKPQGYVEQRSFYDSSEYTQSFEIVLHAGDKLVIKSEMDAALESKANASDVKNEFIGTLEEWNRLTTAEKKAFDTYQITDDYTGGGGLPNYSTTEQKTGRKWIDGRDVFCIVISCGTLPNTTQKLINSGLSNITVIDIHGVAIKSGAVIPLPYPTTTGQNIQLHYSASTNQVSITTVQDLTSYTESYAYLLYVKNPPTT